MGKGKFHKNKIGMKYVAAYCMMALAGKTDVSTGDLKKFLKAAGVSDINDQSVTSVCDALKGKQLHEVINAGFGKISSLSLGGGGGSGGQQAGPAETKAAAKEEVKAEEEPEEEEEDMDLGDLFG